MWHLAGRMGLWQVFGNTLPPSINLRYLRYGRQCRAVAGHYGKLMDWPFRSGAPVVVERALSPATAAEMSAKVSAAVERGELKRGSDVSFMIGVPKPIDFFGPSVLDIFDGPLGAAIEKILGSRFRIEWLDYYRTLPGTPVKSWLWHIDNDPPYVLKVLLYITDSNERNGATRMLSITETRQRFREGYFGVKNSERAADFATGTAGDVQEMKAGDAMIFCTNVLHKGGVVHEGFRDVMSFLILPSRIPWREDLVARGLDYIHNASGFPVDPVA
jgi:hypothetical protein